MLTDGILYRKDSTENISELVSVCFSSASSHRFFRVPMGVYHIAANAFTSNDTMKYVILPESVKEIGDEAFSASCIESIIISEDISTIGTNVFRFCYKLRDIYYERRRRVWESGSGGRR